MMANNRPLMVRTVLVGIVLGVIGLVLHGIEEKPVAAADKPPEKDKTSQAWNLEDAKMQLALHPNDPYLQYVVMQLARREGKIEETAREIERIIARNNNNPNERAQQVDLFSIFSGALAVQESLQLDSMRGERGARPRRNRPAPELKGPKNPDAPQPAPLDPAVEAEKRRKVKVAVASLKGPQVKSHPWEKMLGDKKPDVGVLARVVPEDFYYIEFRSLSKMLDVMDSSELWSKYVYHSASRDARTSQMGERLKQQLVMETNPLLKPVYDLVVEEVAVTGGDLYLSEGSDVTVIFRARQMGALKARMDGFLSNAEKRRPDVKRTTGEYLGVPYVHLASPDRSVCVYSAYPGDNLHVRSNSKVALERILEAIAGKRPDGQVVRRLGDSLEYRYIRTLMPRGAQEEDGFVYLSDPFIRRVVGPQLKLTERRRILCYNHLRMIGHGALMYRTEYGKAATSLDELEKTGCTPGTFGLGAFACHEGGKYALSADGSHGTCSHHGHSMFLTPCCETPVDQATGEEADEYQDFVEDYNQYWRMYFDPIAVRLQVTPQRYRMETIVLPLIDNSIYTALASSLGGKPETLDALPVPKRNIFTVAARLNKEELLKLSGLEEATDQPTVHLSANQLRQVGVAMHTYHGINGHLPAAANVDKQGKPLLSWRVHLLPFMDQDDLYKQFRLNEPWDSEHNKKLIAKLPGVYRGSNPKLAEEGKTTFLVPVGEKTIFPGGDKKSKLSQIPDGTSNTIMAVEARDEEAVIWTKPDELKIDLKKPHKGLAGRHGDGFLVLFADGEVRWLRDTIDAEKLAACFTSSGGEVASVEPADEKRLAVQRGLPRIPGIDSETHEKLIRELLKKGVGNQVGLHVYDAVPMFDFNMPQFLGLMAGTFNGGRRGGFLGGEEVMISFLVASLNAPVYISIPVQDAKVVDVFLDELDKILAVQAREFEGGGLFGLKFDFYKAPLKPDRTMRVGTVRLGPVKFRLYWARIGDGFYLASKSFILDDLVAAEAARTGEAKDGKKLDLGPTGHGMVRVRMRNWDQVLPDYRRGWAEDSREACLNNQGPLSSVGRAVAAVKLGATDEARGDQMHQQADRLHGVHFYCPEGGRYLLSEDGRSCRCSIHGTPLEPKQSDEPGDKSSTTKLLQSVTGLTATLTFLEDGLHAVVVIDRK